MQTNRRWCGAILVCAVVVLAHLGRAQAVLINTHTDASLSVVACNGRVGFRTSESAQGTDLNGDGDKNDFVFQVLDLGTGIITTVPDPVTLAPGLDASGPLACAGDLFAFGVGEANQGGLDVSGDGDTQDFILHVYDAAAATLMNVGLPVTRVALSPSLVAFTVPEGSVGPGGTDLNLDGDRGDNVLHVFDPSTATTTNVERDASSDIVVVGKRVAFPVNEFAQTSVLNGDGDMNDNVLHIYDAATSTLVNTGLQANPGIQFDGNTVAFTVSEAGQNQSLNGDADRVDSVLHLYCLSSPPCVSLGAINVQKAAAQGFTFAGDYVAFKIPERAQGQDLNGDGDTRDQVLNVYQVSTNTVTNTNFAATGTPRIAGNFNSFVAFRVPERDQGRTDLNGDGDTIDTVIHVYDITTNTMTNTHRAVGLNCLDRLAADCFTVRGDLLVMKTDERKQGKTDLNGDLWARDLVVEAWRFSTGTLLSSGKATVRGGGLAIGNSIVAFRRAEPRENLVLNGDGDTKDKVMAVFDTATSTASNLGNEAEPGFVVEGNTVVFRTFERAQAVDLNNDSDLTDTVLQYQAF